MDYSAIKTAEHKLLKEQSWHDNDSFLVFQLNSYTVKWFRLL